jgi:hypothetical protein
MRLKNATEIGWFSAIPVRWGRINEVGIKFVRPFPPAFANSLPARDSMLVAETDDETRYPGDVSTADWA